MCEARDAIKHMLDGPSEEVPEHPCSEEIVSSFRKLADAEGEWDETPPQYPLSSAGASPFLEKAGFR